MKVEKPAQSEGRQLAPGEERRRSQRVTLRVAVKLHVSIEGKPAIIHAFTADVNDHGAMIYCPEALAVDARFVLEHVNTHQQIGCRVTRPPQALAKGFRVPVEFDHGTPGFWQITFPPTDWKPLAE
ncbi:MAG: PilZ domain-containing protein [Candidatus Acidiferrales bacterium]